MHTHIWSEKLEGRSHLEDLSTDYILTLKCALRKQMGDVSRTDLAQDTLL
jgi:hypothetical protein